MAAANAEQAIGPELFFGLVGAIGTDLSLVADQLAQELRRVNYLPELLRLSKLISQCAKYWDLEKKSDGPEDERINAFMDSGDDLRRTAERGDAVVLLAMSEVQNVRERRQGAADKPVPRCAYIFNSLKHPNEVETLREVYGQAFFLISAYSPREVRLKRLCESIARSRQDYRLDQWEPNAKQLNEKDEQEVGDEYGQNVRETFPHADIFVDASTPDALAPQLKRAIDLLFGYPYTTPTVDEYGMFHARAAALRSADLSRQVGAVITTSDGEIISAGCNEVPKAGGGAVWEGREEDIGKDYRDFRMTYDSTARWQREMLSEIFERFSKAGWLDPKLRDTPSETLAARALFEGPNAALKGTRPASTLEFGRIVHAEMSAITDGARRGLAVKGATLYCTTFPCHMCARHIIAAGIKQVMYIEPYPKSLAKELYDQSIRVDRDSTADADAVEFKPFVGIAPRRYLEFFAMPRRKDSRDHVIQWTPARAQPRVKQFPIHIDLEIGHLAFLSENAVRLGVTSEVPRDPEALNP
jgi:deoxycytidylate deaminase